MKPFALKLFFVGRLFHSVSFVVIDLLRFSISSFFFRFSISS